MSFFKDGICVGGFQIYSTEEEKVLSLSEPATGALPENAATPSGYVDKESYEIIN